MDDYKYKGIKLMPEIFADIMLSLFSNKQFTRQECVDAVVSYHKEHGGICDKQSYIGDFKRATRILRKKGYDMTNPALGVWRINQEYDGFTTYRDALSEKYGNVTLPDDYSKNIDKPENEDIAMDITTNDCDDIEFNDECEEIGSGNETVYIYYYPIYRKYAQIRGKDSWYCKIGMTTRDLWDRIYSQAGTCFPEEPYVALIIKCDDAHKLEQAIHNILKMMNKWVDTAPGKEWFDTTPEEVKKIYGTISCLTM